MSENTRNSPVVLHGGDDLQMAKAQKMARMTFRYFWRELAWERRRIIPGLDVACVKVAFSDPPGTPNPQGNPEVEHMWITDVDFDGKVVKGTLINEPNWLTSVSVGDDIAIAPGKVGDWLYAINGTAYGAFTVNVMRSQMGSSERKQHDAAWGQDFGDPTKIRVVPDDFIGVKKKGFLGKLFGGQENQDLRKVDATEHPMAVNMVPSLEQFCKEDPDNITSADDRGFTMLHDLALAGTTLGVDVLLRHGAEPNLKAKNGMTPLMLAKCLGWQNVVQRLN